MNKAASVLLLAACASTADTTVIAVGEPNELHVTTLETTRSASRFELRALDAAAREVGHVSLHTGEIADLPAVLDLGHFGTEITLAVSDQSTRLITRETELFHIASPEPAIQELLQIATVASTLADANILLASADAPGPRETGYSGNVGSCTPADLLTTPLAKQCCYDGWTWFINPSNQLAIRLWNAYGSLGVRPSCRPSNGTGTCSGMSCYYGPNGFARATFSSAPAGKPYPKVWGGWDDSMTEWACQITWYSAPQTPQFPSVTGTFARDRGCCLNGSGPCGPGLIACTSCGGGGAAGLGAWDY